MILVSGASGHVGSEVLRQLSAKGVPVRALVHNPEKAGQIQGYNAEIVYGDFDQPDTLVRALEGATRAFLISNISLRQDELQDNFIRAAQRAGVKHVVKSSAVGASPDSPVSYLRRHAESEQQLAESGMDYTVIRPHIFMQQMFEFVPTIVQEGAFYASIPHETRFGTVDVRDIAATAVGVLTGSGHEGKTYIVTGPEALTYDDMATQLGEVVGKPVTYIVVPGVALRAALLQYGLPDWWAQDAVTMLDLFSSDPQYSQVTDVVERVGKKTPITFAQFVRDFAGVFSGVEEPIRPV